MKITVRILKKLAALVLGLLVLSVLVFTMSHIFEIFSFVDACPFNFHGCTDFLHDFRVPA